MEYSINLKETTKKKLHLLSDRFYGESAKGKKIAFTNYYMQMDNQPFFGISGECHYSRVNENQWEDTVLKMKMGGINIVSTYIFWNHHEEIEGTFRFDGCRNVRKFLQICKKHGLYVIVRIGPFDHGEVRNGGIPDWMYGKPFEVRSLNEGFLAYTRKLYHELAKQFEGLYFKDDGPIIGTQIENEYMHSAAPWEMTTGVTNEWLPGGHEGDAYMKALKKIAQEEGIRTPFYTCTGWGGAATPSDEMLPLWGGYAYWPWIFYNYKGEHPATPEYIYRDNHNNKVKKTYNFEPAYEPESIPYACCEMGGGMTSYYNYRFRLAYESVDAMANIKMAGGCNFLGYYMYRGGSNPKGEKIPYLNECQCPKISYDYQAPISEFGQLKPSFYRLKALHLFAENFKDSLCHMVTVLPEGSQDIEPEDIHTLRFAARYDGTSGFLFLNNFQDHVECAPKKNEKIKLELPDKEIEILDISLAAGEEAILPFAMDIEGFHLVYAKAQPLSVIRTKEKTVYFFFIPKGMTPEYVWDLNNVEALNGKAVNTAEEERLTVTPPSDQMSSYTLAGNSRTVEIVTLTREQSLQYYEIVEKEEKTAMLCDKPVTFDGEKFRVEKTGEKDGKLLFYPSCPLAVSEAEEKTEGLFKGICVKSQGKNPEKPQVEKVGPSRYVIQLPEQIEECKEVLLQIEYRGDIGQAFIGSELVADNFSNHAVWEIGLKDVWKPEMGNCITIVITPQKENVKIDVSSTMAGRLEQEGNTLAELLDVRLVTVYEETLRVKNL